MCPIDSLKLYHAILRDWNSASEFATFNKLKPDEVCGILFRGAGDYGLLLEVTRALEIELEEILK